MATLHTDANSQPETNRAFVGRIAYLTPSLSERCLLAKNKQWQTKVHLWTRRGGLSTTLIPITLESLRGILLVSLLVEHSTSWHNWVSNKFLPLDDFQGQSGQKSYSQVPTFCFWLPMGENCITAIRFPCEFTQRLAKTAPWNHIFGLFTRFSAQWCKFFFGKGWQWKFFFSPIGMYRDFAHWDHITHTRWVHSKLKFDNQNKTTYIRVNKW